MSKWTWSYRERIAGKALPRNLCTANQAEVTNRVRESLLRRLGKRGTISSGSKIPASYSGGIVVDGHYFVVLRSSVSSRGKSSAHRLFWKAPDGTLVPTGRINQARICGGTGGRRR